MATKKAENCSNHTQHSNSTVSGCMIHRVCSSLTTEQTGRRDAAMATGCPAGRTRAPAPRRPG